MGIPDTTGLGLEDDELQRRAALSSQLAPPITGLPPKPQGAPPVHIPSPSQNDKTPPLTLRGISPQLEQRTAADEAEAKRLQETGSGISQIQHGSKPGGIGIAKPHPVLGTALRGLDVLGSVVAPGVMANIPGTELHHQLLGSGARTRLGQDIGEQEKEAQTAQTQAATEAVPAETAYKQAQTEALQHPQAKPKEEEWSVVPGMVGPSGEIVQWEKNSGQMRFAPGLTGAHALREPNEPERDKDISDYLQAHGLSDTPANRERARTSIASRGKQEPGNYMPLYDPKTGQITGAWDPKSGHLISAPKLPGTTSAGGAMANKAEAQNQMASATVHSFTRYQKTFHDLSPKLTEDDRRAMQVLTSHQDNIARGFLDKAASGVLDSMFGVPLTGYSEKAMGGIMTKDQFDKLSPAGKKMLADYFNAVIQNFGNMKQIMGSIGRNPIQLLAEINTIPLPYVDSQTADTMFADKLEDLRMRNPNLAPEASNSAQGGTGKTLSMAAIQQAAKDNNVSVDETKRQAIAAGYAIQ
ncbi:MAG: hypothetical protein ACRD23_15625 [Terriglobales bacterium]